MQHSHTPKRYIEAHPTIKYLFNLMSPEERKKFEKKYNYNEKTHMMTPVYIKPLSF